MCRDHMRQQNKRATLTVRDPDTENITDSEIHNDFCIFAFFMVLKLHIR